MKIKTSEATGLQLDWGLAKVMGVKRIIVNWRGVWVEDEGFKVGDDCRGWVCHTDPAVCMGLIERHRLNIGHGSNGNTKFFAQSSVTYSECWPSGDTLAEAVARCVISTKLGEQFEVPDELGVQS